MSGVLDQFMEKLCAEREEKGKLKTLCELVYDQLLPVEEAARRSKLSRADFLKEMRERYPSWNWEE